MAKHVSSTSSMELSHYATTLRRRWVYVASALGVGVLLATVLMVVVPSKSTSTTLVNINLISANAFSASRPPSDLLDMETEQAMARSTSVMSEVAADLGNGWTKSSVRAATEATLLPDGTILRIRFTGGSPTEAADGATLVADKYLAYRSEEAQGRVDSASERLVVRRDSLRKQLSAANAEVSDTVAGTSERLAAELSRQTVAEELSTVTTQLNELRVVTTGGGSVLTEADPRQTQSSPNRPLMLLSGILGGLLSGLVIAFVVNVLDRRVRDPYDVAGAGGGATVAHLDGSETRVPPVGVEAEQIRAVRERVMAATAAERPVIAVIDVGPDDAIPTDVAVNLAASLADSGLRTDLVILDYPVDVLVKVLHDLTAREISGRHHVRTFRSRVMPTLEISVPDTSGSRLATIDVVVDLVSQVDRSAAVTVVALSPAAGSAARLAAGRFADQVLFAVHEMSTGIDDLATVATELTAVDARTHGTVLLPEGRHLAGHPSVGEGAALLRAAAPSGASSSAFTGGAVSGARSNALMEVMEDLVTRADDEPADDEPAVIGPVAEDPAVIGPAVIGPAHDVPPEAVLQVAPETVDEAPVDEMPAEEAPAEEMPADGVPEDEASVNEAPVDEIPVDEVPDTPVDEVPEAPVDEAPVEEVSERPVDEGIRSLFFDRTLHEDRLSGSEDVSQPEPEPAVELEARSESEEPSAAPAVEPDDEEPAAEVDSEPDPEVEPEVEPEIEVKPEPMVEKAKPETTRANGSRPSKKKRGRGRPPAQARRVPEPVTTRSDDQAEGAQAEETQPEEAKVDAAQLEEAQLEEAQPEDAQPEDAQPEEAKVDAAQPEEAQPEEAQLEEAQPEEPQVDAVQFVEALVGGLIVDDEDQAEVPANENSWAFTR